MTRKITRIRRFIKETEKKLKCLEENWENDPKYHVVKDCGYCNISLEDDDYIPDPETNLDSCKFCGNLV